MGRKTRKGIAVFLALYLVIANVLVGFAQTTPITNGEVQLVSGEQVSNPEQGTEQAGEQQPSPQNQKEVTESDAATNAGQQPATQNKEEAAESNTETNAGQQPEPKENSENVQVQPVPDDEQVAQSTEPEVTDEKLSKPAYAVGNLENVSYIDMSKVLVEADDELYSTYSADKVLDGVDSTIWHTKYEAGETDFPHYLEFTLQNPTEINVIEYSPRGNHGAPHYIKGYKIYIAPTVNGQFGDTPYLEGELTLNDRVINFPALQTVGKLKIVFINRWMPNNEKDTYSMSIGDIKFGKKSSDVPAGEQLTLPQHQFSANASSNADGNLSADKAIDGNADTLWHGRWEGANIPPHWISIKLDKDNVASMPVKSIEVTSRRDKDADDRHPSLNGAMCDVLVSQNGTDYTLAVDNFTLKSGRGAKTVIPVFANAAYIKLAAANDAFQSVAELNVTVYTSPKDDLFTLFRKIVELEKFAQQVSKDVGPDFNQYPNEALDNLKDAINNAKTALEQSAGYNEALTTLAEAQQTFLDSKKMFSAQYFTELLVAAEKLNAETVVGTSDGNCTQEAKSAFEAAINTAKAIDTSSAEITALYNAYLTLQNAMSAFRSSIIIKNDNESMDISGTWKFEMTAKEEASTLNETVKLPGSMDENKKGNSNTANITQHHLNRDYVYVGPATYQREITVPANWSGKNITLNLERTKKTRVWLDGNLVGPQQKSYTTAHVYNVTEFIKPGTKQTLTIEVDNSETGMPFAMYHTFEDGAAWSHQVSEFTQTNWNGIIGKMELQATPPVYINNFQIRPNVDEKNAKVTITVKRRDKSDALSGVILLTANSWNNDKKSHSADPQELHFSFAAGADETTVTLNYKMGSEMLLWDEFSPTLYKMTAVLRAKQGENQYSSVEERDFGMRKFTTKEINNGKQFQINDRTTMLRGEINCAAFPRTGYSPMELEDWLAIMQTYKNYGMNHVRFHTWTPPDAAFKAADMLGLYLNFELPHWGRKMFGDIEQGDDTDVKYYEEDTKKIFNSYLNSPSAVMFALGNEEHSGFFYYEEFLKFCTALEPTLLYSDIAGHSTYPRSADFAAKYISPQYLPQVVPNNNWDYADAVKKAPIAILGHEPGQLQVYPHYEEEIPKYKDAIVKPRNLEFFWNVLKQAGIGDMSPQFNESTGGLSAMMYRYFTESYIRTNGSGGFHLLGLQDFPGQGTALVGILDAFLDSKGDVTEEEFRQSCSELVVMAKMKQFVFTNDQTFTADVLISNYSAEDVTSPIKWSIQTLSGTVVASGIIADAAAPQGCVTTVGKITANLNGITKAEQLELKLELTNKPEPSSKKYYSVGTNNYSLWVYPKQIDTRAPEEIEVYRNFSNKAQKSLSEGKKVLIISEGTTESLPKSRALTFRPDFWSPMFHREEVKSTNGYMLGSYIDKDHPLFKNFPTDSYANWQWYNTVAGGRGLLINGAPEELKPIMQPIATIDLPDRLAAIFEANVSGGKLMFCSINLLDKTDQVSKQLLACIYDYMQSNEFNPKASVDAQFLKNLIPSKDFKGIKATVAKNQLAVRETAAIEVKCINYKGETINMPPNAELAFVSTDNKIAEVSSKGVITAVGRGVVKVTAKMLLEGYEYTSELIITAGQATLEQVLLDGAKFSASSSNSSYPLTNIHDGRLDTFWHSDYLNPEQKMPQWVTVELKEPVALNMVVCRARKDQVGGAILEGKIYVSNDGKNYKEVCAQTFEKNKNDRMFYFKEQTAKFIKISVEKSDMDSESSNAAAIAEIELLKGDTITSVKEIPQQVVRFGTPIEKVLKKYPMPKEVEVTIGEDKTDTLPVVWNLVEYNPNVAGTYTMEGILFKENVANVKNLKAIYSIKVLPKNTTSPANKEELSSLISSVNALKESDYTAETWANMKRLYKQAVDFNAMTGAIQHDVDVIAESLKEAIEALVRADEQGNEHPANKEELSSLISSVHALKESDYTAETWANLKQVHKQAVDLNAIIDATQYDVDAMVENLKKAIKALVKAGEQGKEHPAVPENPNDKELFGAVTIKPEQDVKLPDNIKFTVKAKTTIETEQILINGESAKFAYDIKATGSGILSGKLPGKVKVRIKLSPQLYSGAEQGKLKVFYINGKAYEDMNASSIKIGEEWYIEFLTNHFSIYAVTAKEDADVPATNKVYKNSNNSADDQQLEFWKNAAERIRSAEKGDTVEVNAKWYDKVFYFVMDALRENKDVSLIINWNGGSTIVIPSGKAQPDETGRIYWPLSLLAELYEHEPTGVNPETGGVITVTAPLQAEVQTIVTPKTAGLEEEKITGVAVDNARKAERGDVTTKETADSADSQAYSSAQNVPFTAIMAAMLLITAAGVGVFIWKKNKKPQ